MTVEPRQLLAELATPLGVYQAGATVLPVGRRGPYVLVCLDPDGFHPVGRCHRAAVAPERLTPPQRWLPCVRWDTR